MNATSSRRRRATIAALLLALLTACSPTMATPIAPGPTPAAVSDRVTVAEDALFDVQDSDITVHPAPASIPSPTPEPVPAPGAEPGGARPAASVPDPGTANRPPVPAATAWSLPEAAPAPAKGPGATVSVYVAPPPVGNDANDASEHAPVATLGAAQTRARAAQDAAGTPVNIDVIVAGGQYTADGVTWKLAAPGQRIQFAPAPGQVPVFTGTGNGAKYWLEILTSAAAGSTTFDVRGITVRNYVNGLRISTGYLSDLAAVPISVGNGPRLNAPVVTAMTFEQIGSAYAAGNGYAALHLQNTDGAHVSANTFTRIENVPAGAWLVHAVYAVVAINTTVTGNDFTTVSGDPVRTRNATSATVTSNRFTRTGQVAAVSDWFCGIECATGERKAPECAAGDLTVSGNLVDRAYTGKTLPQSAVVVDPSQAPPGC